MNKTTKNLLVLGGCGLLLWYLVKQNKKTNIIIENTDNNAEKKEIKLESETETNRGDATVMLRLWLRRG